MILETFVDALGNTYVIDGKTAYVTVYRCEYRLTVEEARRWWRRANWIAAERRRRRHTSR